MACIFSFLCPLPPHFLSICPAAPSCSCQAFLSIPTIVTGFLHHQRHAWDPSFSLGCHPAPLAHCRVPAISAALQPETSRTSVGEEGEDYPSSALSHVTWSEDGRCDWGVIDIAICLDVWLDQLSGWSGSTLAIHLSRFPTGNPRLIAQRHVFWAVGSFLRTGVRKCHSTVASEGECGGVDGERTGAAEVEPLPLSLGPVTTRVITTTTYLRGVGDRKQRRPRYVVVAAGSRWGCEWSGNARLLPSARNTAGGEAGPR
ncbi:hypothetical protein B0T18DRAFT_220940 [Schizothecium vesticola]|uniref:Uncharacterized protein n=1 Tax=Schizothecium vesticola TaxID=314040 RepID=A0AA40EKH6_9PEZI|nr:hypothetical protein B0T18DRAFT_220940 [Schizothecium vesticola]